MSDAIHTPFEAECLRQGNLHFYGLNGKDIDCEQFAVWMQRGHELGYLNCTAELCSCYTMGDVVTFGRPQFRSFRGLALGEELVLGCEELPVMLLRLCE